MSGNEYVKEIPINSYDELARIIQGKTDFCENLRDEFIFRGIDDETYKLVPSALREGNKLDNYVDEDFRLTLALSHEQAVECGFANEDNYYESVKHFTINKYGQLTDGQVKDYAWCWEEFQCVKELNAIMNFLSYADKVGLKVPVNQKIRQLLENKFQNIFNHEEGIWPDEDYYELMALAQHYGIPTRALDWSYDYRVSLYFAIKNILNDDYLISDRPENGALWAFNYKYFTIDYIFENKTLYHSTYYRPEYNSNPNLSAQKGLFTFMIKRVNEDATQPFNQFIGEFLDTYDKSRIKMPNNEQVFYKFVIPEDEKPNILKELYSEGYSEEYLFPGYKGVTQSVANRVKLEKLLLKTISHDKKNVLLVMDEDKIEKITVGEKLYEFRRHNFTEEVNDIFIYSKESEAVIGVFRGNEIFANTPIYFWKNFSDKSGLTKHELFDYFEHNGWGWAIKINYLRIFDNPIKICNFKEPANYCYVEDKDELKFLLNFKL